MAVLKVGTYIITSIAATWRGCDTSGNACRDIQNGRYY